MRSHKGFVLLGVFLMVCTAMAFWGCGDDNDNPINYGDLNDPSFVAVDEQMSFFIDSTLGWFNEGLGSIAALPGDGTVDPVQFGPGDPDATTDSLSVNYDGGWHVIHVAYHQTSGYAAVVDDSIQFVRDGQPTQDPSDLEQLRFRHHWNWGAPDTTVTHMNMFGHASFDYADLNTDQATINGTNTQTSQWKFASQDSVVHRDITIESDLSDFKVDKTPSGWAQGCPTSGNASATVTMNYQKNDEAPVESTWMFTLQFLNGAVTATATSAGQTWTYTRQECQPPTSN